MNTTNSPLSLDNVDTYWRSLTVWERTTYLIEYHNSNPRNIFKTYKTGNIYKWLIANYGDHIAITMGLSI